MSYERTYWIPRQGTGLNRFTKDNETDTEVYLTNSPDSVTQQGTAFEAGLVNNIESGIATTDGKVAEILNAINFDLFVGASTAQSAGALNWSAIAKVGNDVYATVNGGDIYKQTGGTGSFAALSQTSRAWSGITQFGSDVYACVKGGDIYKQTGGTGNFIALGLTTRQWTCITTDGTDIYLGAEGDYVYKQTAGTGEPVAWWSDLQLQWSGIKVFNGNLYASVYQGDIYIQYGLTGNPIAQDSTNWWTGLAYSGNDVYACSSGSAVGVFKQTSGNGQFELTDHEQFTFTGIDFYGDDLYSLAYQEDIYKTRIYSGNTWPVTSSFTLPVFPVGTRKRVYNESAGDITITLSGSETIRGASSYVLGTLCMIEIEKVSSTLWVLTVKDEDIIDDSSRILDIDGNRTPDLPDDPAGITYLRDKNWTVTTGWTGGTGSTLSIESSTLKVVTTAGNSSNAASSSATYQNKQLIVILRSDTPLTNITTVTGSTVFTAMSFGSIGGNRYMASIYWSRSGSDNLAIFPNYNSTAAITWYLETIYIGTGANLSRITDNTGRNAMQNIACIPSRSKWGKWLRFNGISSYMIAPTPVFLTTGTINIYVRFGIASVTKTEILLNNRDASLNNGIVVLKDSSTQNITLVLRDATTSQLINIKTAVTDTTTPHHIAIKISGSTVLTKYDSDAWVSTAQTVTAITSVTPMRIGCAEAGPGTNGFTGELIARADARILTDAEIEAWKINPRSVDSGITDPFSFDFRNLPTYADNAAATAAGLPVGKAYATSTGAIFRRY